MSVVQAWVDGLIGAVRADDSYGPLAVDVPRDSWREAIASAAEAGLNRLEFLTGVDELADGFTVVALLSTTETPLESVLVRTRLDRSNPHVGSVESIHAGAQWHERETAEMFGIAFDGASDARTLLLAGTPATHPLRKDFYLDARAKPWPGAKEPGESDGDVSAAAADEGPRRRRRRQVPPGVPPTGRSEP